MNNDSALPTFHFMRETSIARAESTQNRPVTPGSPAMEVMTDLTLVKAATITPDCSLKQAEQQMVHQGVRLLFVVHHMPELLGLITLTDLQGDKPMRLVQQRNLHHSELRVEDVMTPVAAIDAIDLGQMRTATVSNIIATLRRVGRRHLLVVENAALDMPHVVRGVISVAQVERQLGTRLDFSEIAHSFADIEKALT